MKVAIVGCGQIADAHINEAQKIPGIEVVAVADLNHHMAAQAAVRFKVPGIYTDIAAMLSEVKPDIVHITTPPSSHLALGRLAMEHGAHVYVEKPFALNCADAEELVDFAKRHGRLICVGHNMVFDSPFQRLRQMFRSGQLGEVVHVEAHMGYGLSGQFGSILMGDPSHWIHRLPGGLAQNNISHPLSMMLEFITDERPQVVARGLRLRSQRFGDIRDKFFDEIRATLVGRDVTGTLTFSCRAQPVQMFINLFGTKKQVICHMDSRTVREVEGSAMPGPFRRIQWAYRDLKEARREHRAALRRLAGGRMLFFEGMNALMSQFYAAVRGEADLPIPATEAVRVTAIMDDIFSNCDRQG